MLDTGQRLRALRRARLRRTVTSILRAGSRYAPSSRSSTAYSQPLYAATYAAGRADARQNSHSNACGNRPVDVRQNSCANARQAVPLSTPLPPQLMSLLLPPCRGEVSGGRLARASTGANALR